MPRLRAERRQPCVGAFFDMDKTLISENSGTLYMKYLYARGEVDGWEMVKGLGAYLRYKAGLLDIDAWTKNMMRQFKGRSERTLSREANQWFQEMVGQTVYPEAEKLVKEHQAAGHVVAIVSLAEPPRPRWRGSAPESPRRPGASHIPSTSADRSGVRRGRIAPPAPHRVPAWRRYRFP